MEHQVLHAVADQLEKTKLSDDAKNLSHTLSDGEHRRGERFVLYLDIELSRGWAPVLVEKAVPTYAWTEEIIKDHFERDIPGMTQVVILSPTTCILFKGHRSIGEGFSNNDINDLLPWVARGRYWIGKEVHVAPSPVMLGEAHRILARAKNFIRQHWIQKIFHPKGVSSPEMTAQAVRRPSQAQRGWGLIRRADKYSAQLMAKGYTHHHQPRVEETMATAGYLSEDDQYESALNRGSDGVYDSKTASPYDELGDDVVEYDTETSHLVTIAEWNRQRRKQKQRCDRWERQRQRQRREKGATLPLFKNSQKEGATTYLDWRNDVDELIQDKLNPKRIRSLVMQSLEGMPKDTARLVYKNTKRGRAPSVTFLLQWTRPMGGRRHLCTSSQSCATSLRPTGSQHKIITSA